MRIGELAKKVGINPKTLRYWEEIGVLPPPPRDSSGYRVYSEEYIHMCIFIKKAKTLGLKLEEIREIINLWLGGNKPCDRVKSIIREKIKTIDEVIEELRRRKTLLERLLEESNKNSRWYICPLIESIE
ncbi:MAG TPA: heavy metal-responsive transcriptional regulator [Aquificaceae bacterium]|nr:heavy metal-responsive transcriptional regulator [Aquificaceae bacterium]HIQ48058.1 heavy metal-responsive transcriptional regulator [Aquifex aeolicus]